MKSRSIGLQLKLILLGLALVVIPLLVSTLTNLHFSRSTKDQIQGHLSESLGQSALDYLKVLAQRDQVVVEETLKRVTQDAERLAASSNLIQYATAETGDNKRLNEQIRQRLDASMSGLVDLFKTRQETVARQLESDIRLAEATLKSFGVPQTAVDNLHQWQAVNQVSKAETAVELPLLSLGNQVLYPQSSFDVKVPVVDAVTDISGSTCTIFQKMNAQGDMLRVATSVKKTDGTRAVGTYIPALNSDGAPNPVVAAVLKGDTYSGRAFVVNDWYQTIYQPLRDSSNEIIGILYVGVKEKDLAGIQQILLSKNQELGASGHFFVMDGKGTLVIHPDSSLVGQPTATALSGIPAADILKSGAPSGLMEWSGADGSRAFTQFVRFPHWDWVLCTTGSWNALAGSAIDDYRDTFKSEMNTLRQRATLAVSGTEKPLYSQVRFLAADGMERLKLVGGEWSEQLQSRKDEDWFRGALDHGDLFNSGVQIARNTDQPELRIAVPVRHNDKVFGLIAVNLDWAVVREAVLANRYGKTGYTSVTNEQGLLVLHPKYGLADKVNVTDPKFGPLAELIGEALHNKSGADRYQFEGKDKVLAYRPLPVGERTYALVATMEADELLTLAHQVQDDLDRMASRNGSWTLFFALILVLGGTLAAYAAARHTAKPIKQAVLGLNEGAEQVAAASSQVSAASQSLAEGSSEQAASLEETSSALEQMAAMTRQNADNANQANAIVRSALHDIEEAQQSMTALTRSMGDIAKASEETQKIIKTIDEIAFQTNLLALNAAVEAARAGEAGAGFAVVADEVRNLAMRAAAAAGNTAELIEGTAKKVTEGNQGLSVANASFAKVSQGSAKIGELVAEIAAASGEQAEGLDQLNRAVADMDRVVQQNAATAEESASASEELSAQAELVRDYVVQLASVVGSVTDQAATSEPPDTEQPGPAPIDPTRFIRSIAPAANGQPLPRTRVAKPAPRLLKKPSATNGKSRPASLLTGGAPAPGLKPLMEWNDGYSVGDFDLDHQHQQLFKMVNALYAAMQQGQGRTVLEPLLLDLVRYTEKHFQDEERAMAQAAYPELETHHEVHEKLTSQVAEIAARFQSGEAGMTLEVMKFLEDWLKRHILGMDKKYGPYLHEDQEAGKNE